MNNDYGNLELHKVLLRAMQDIDAVCRENNLNYYLHAGTLLGAVNHKGFIPWDDDVDISMLRNDYERFLAIMQERFSEFYFIQNYETDEQYTNNRTVIRILGTKLIHSVESDESQHCEIGIDIVPLDSAPNGKILRKMHAEVIKILDIALQIKCGEIIPQSIFTRCIGLIAKLKRRTLFRWIDSVSTMFNRFNTKKIGLLTYTWKGPWNELSPYENELCDRELYKNPIRVPFEGLSFMTISDPHADLLRRYGPKYGEPYPEEKRISKHDIKSYTVEDWVKVRSGLD